MHLLTVCRPCGVVASTRTNPRTRGLVGSASRRPSSKRREFVQYNTKPAFNFHPIELDCRRIRHKIAGEGSATGAPGGTHNATEGCHVPYWYPARLVHTCRHIIARNLRNPYAWAANRPLFLYRRGDGTGPAASLLDVGGKLYGTSFGGAQRGHGIPDLRELPERKTSPILFANGIDGANPNRRSSMSAEHSMARRSTAADRRPAPLRHRIRCDEGRGEGRALCLQGRC